jgi:hypothetical protein
VRIMTSAFAVVGFSSPEGGGTLSTTPSPLHLPAYRFMLLQHPLQPPHPLQMPLKHALHVAQLPEQLPDGGGGVLRDDRGGQAKLVLMRWQMLSLQRLELG